MKKSIFCTIFICCILFSVSAAFANEPYEVLWTNNNPNSVHNETKDYYVIVEIDKECIVTSMMTYHYFNGGTLPGTITLFAESGEQWGPFQAEGVDGQGDVKNAYWVADVGEIRLSPGRYAIADSDQSTWSSNEASGYNGIAELRGYYAPPSNPFGSGTSTVDNTVAISSDDASDTDSDLQALQQKAENGDVEAQYILGYMYDYGQGAPQDYEQAALWYRKAAEQGYAYAQCNLAYLYETGQGVPQDYELAMLWYRRAAEQGDTYAQTGLGYLYYYGYGVPKDNEQALQWYRKAAELGDMYAQYNLASMYENGEGVQRNIDQAILWYQKAANQGDEDAQASLDRLNP